MAPRFDALERNALRGGPRARRTQPEVTLPRGKTAARRMEMSKEMPGKIVVHTEGTCLVRNGPGGWAAVLQVEENRNLTLRGRESGTTMDRMELTAAVRALQALEKIPGARGADIVLHSDSPHLALPEGVGQVGNRDLQERAASLARSMNVSFAPAGNHAGNPASNHAGNYYQELCEQIAGEEARAAAEDGDTGRSLIQDVQDAIGMEITGLFGYLPEEGKETALVDTPVVYLHGDSTQVRVSRDGERYRIDDMGEPLGLLRTPPQRRADQEWEETVMDDTLTGLRVERDGEVMYLAGLSASEIAGGVLRLAQAGFRASGLLRERMRQDRSQENMEVGLNTMKSRGYDIHEKLRFQEYGNDRHALQRLEAYISHAEGTCKDRVDLDEVDIQKFFGTSEEVLQHAP